MVISEASVWEILQGVKDPEIPVISLVEMGIVRDVEIDGADVHVQITPTFSGCPALNVMEREVAEALAKAGANPTVEVVKSPPWTSDMITAEGRQILKEFGLAPPPVHGGNLVMTFFDVVACPHCDSKNTSLKNAFGTTLCRAIYVCKSCLEPFEQFKPL